MRASKRPLFPARRVEAADDAGHRRAGQRFGIVHRRQQTGQPLREHRFAGAGRADHQQTMAAGRGDLQRALGVGLAAHVGQVGHRCRGDQRGPAGLGTRQRPGLVAGLQRGHHVEQVCGREHRHVGGERSLARTGFGQHERARAVFARHGQRQRERATHGAQRTGQTQFTRELVGRKARRVDLPVGREDAQGDGQVEAAGVFRQLGGREVDGDALVRRKRQPALRECGAHALARLFDLRVGQADEREARQAVGQMHFHLHRRRGHPVQRATHHHRQGHTRPPC
jgi:hypothetical protein